jgi:hypothetical protein
MRYWLKECPRCHGDLRDESDFYGRYIACVQCGHILQQAEEVQLTSTGVLNQPVPAERVAA